MTHSQIVLLVRHGSSEKNVESRHGGKGAPLVPAAETRIITLGLEIQAWETKFHKAIAAPRLQCEETAGLLATVLGIEMEIDQRLEPIYLGVIDGLSNGEVERMHPAIARHMSRWRAAQIEVHEVEIPGMESIEGFYERGLDFIRGVRSDGYSVIVIGTRSILILLASILLGRRPVPGGKYTEIAWANAAYLTFELHDREARIVASLSSIQVD